MMKEETKNSPGRSQKYTEETVMLSMRVPKTKKDAIKKLVNAALKSDLKPIVIPEVDQDAVKSDIAYVPVVDVKITEKILEGTASKIQKKCDCYLDVQGFLRRGKSKPVCKLGKAEHNF